MHGWLMSLHCSSFSSVVVGNAVVVVEVDVEVDVYKKSAEYFYFH
jgi:hypothetical protein